MKGIAQFGSKSNGINVSDKKSKGNPMALLAAIAPSWDSVILPSMAPILQKIIEPKNINKISNGGNVNEKSVSKAAKNSTKILEIKTRIKFTIECASNHSIFVSGVVDNFSKWDPVLPRATVTDILERGVKRTTIEI